jgi:hypothetical protein
VAAKVAWGRIVFSGGRGREVAAWLAVGTGPPDLAAVDRLARMQLHARRLGGCLRVTEMCAELEDLLDLVGLRRELGGEAEEREQVLGVEEGMDRGDPIA